MFEKTRRVAHIFTLLLAPFVSQWVNYSRHSDSLNFRMNNKFERKRGQKKPKDMVYNLFKEFFFKNILLQMNDGMSKIHSVRAYIIMYICICHNLDGFSDWICNNVVHKLPV